MISYKVLIILTFTINISHCFTYTDEEYKNEINICVECLEAVGFTRDLGFINYFVGMEYATGSAVDSFDTKIKILLEDTLKKKINGKDYHSLMNKQMLIDHVYLYYEECINFKPEPNVFPIWYYCKEFIVEKNGFCGLFTYFHRLSRCERVIKTRFHDNTYSDIIFSFYFANKKNKLSKDTSTSNTSKDTGKNDTPSTSNDSKSNSSKENNTKLKTWKDITESNTWKNVEMELKKSIDYSESNTSQEADIYYQYLLRIIVNKASKFHHFLPENWCNQNIPGKMNKLELKKSNTESQP